VFDSVTQHVEGAALGNFPLQPGEELPSGRAILVECQ